MKLNELSINQLKAQIEQLLKQSSPTTSLSITDLITDQEVCKIFKITPKTLANYRKQGLITFCKLGNKYYYFPQLLLLDMLKLYNDS